MTATIVLFLHNVRSRDSCKMYVCMCECVVCFRFFLSSFLSYQCSSFSIFNFNSRRVNKRQIKSKLFVFNLNVDNFERRILLEFGEFSFQWCNCWETLLTYLCLLKLCLFMFVFFTIFLNFINRLFCLWIVNQSECNWSLVSNSRI